MLYKTREPFIVESPRELIMKHEKEEMFNEALASLPENQKEIFEECSGLYGEKKTFSAVAIRYNVCRTTISNRYTSALKKITGYVTKLVKEDKFNDRKLTKERIKKILEESAAEFEKRKREAYEERSRWEWEYENHRHPWFWNGGGTC